MTANDDELTCRELVELVTDYLEGGMTPEDRVRFEQHLTYCDGCANHLLQMRATLQVVGVLGEDSIPEAAKQDLLRVFRDWKSRAG